MFVAITYRCNKGASQWRNVELFTFSSTSGFMANNRLCELIRLLLFAASMYRHKLTDPFCHSDWNITLRTFEWNTLAPCQLFWLPNSFLEAYIWRFFPVIKLLALLAGSALISLLHFPSCTALFLCHSSIMMDVFERFSCCSLRHAPTTRRLSSRTFSSNFFPFKDALRIPARLSHCTFLHRFEFNLRYSLLTF